jgi:hypothetical protein
MGESAIQPPSGDSNRPPCRQGKVFVSGHFDADTVAELHEHLARLRRKTGARVTVQEVIAAGLAMVLVATGKKSPPRELKAALQQPFLNPPQRAARKSSAGKKPAPASVSI